MNKLLTTSVFALAVTLSTAAVAAPQNGGFQGPGIAPTTVAQALEMKDDTAVILTGQIEKSLGKEKYLFKDATGSITIEVDDEDWRGVNVSPNDTITIKGDVDKEMMKDAKVDVDSVEIKK